MSWLQTPFGTFGLGAGDWMLVVALAPPSCWHDDNSRKESAKRLRNEQKQDTSHDCSNEILWLRTRLKNRQWRLSWMIEVPDIHFESYVDLLRPDVGNQYRYSPGVNQQITFSAASFRLQHPDHLKDDIGAYMAGSQECCAANAGRDDRARAIRTL